MGTVDTGWFDGWFDQTVVDADTVFIPRRWPPLRVITWLLADLPSTAAEEMEGEVAAGVPHRNYRDTAGPAESELCADEG